ncbi:MAG: c-type cytochrome [Bryobacteraceae bacterium]|nr:c-type cytochrome [Bryobacteraceae bacterium]
MAAAAEGAEPAALYRKYCADCHDPEKAGQTPDIRALRRMSAGDILRSMESGAMQPHAAELSDGDRKALARHLGVWETMRVDLLHSGTATEERFQLDGVHREGPWPGPREKTADDLDLGKYFFEAREEASGALLYSRGYASIFGEWELTGEAKTNRQSFSESVRFPFPDAAVKLTIKKRDAKNKFVPVWSGTVRPETAAAPPPGEHHVWEVVKNGEPADKVDILLLGDGYAAGEMETWREDARRVAELLLSTPPFRERRSAFNVWAIDTPAAASGVARPSDGVKRETPLGVTYDAFGSERYALAFDNKRLRRIAAQAPYEFLLILMNERKYGGGGIFNLYATAAAHNEFTPYLAVHEFAHHFAGLADEYYTSDVAYVAGEAPAEPWEPNATVDPKARKWRDLLTPGVPLPTPWPKAEFEALQARIQAERKRLRAGKRPEAEMEALFNKERDLAAKLLWNAEHAGNVGAFEGSNYLAKGSYRPQVDCLMFTRNETGFCAVCRRAIERVQMDRAGYCSHTGPVRGRGGGIRASAPMAQGSRNDPA